MRKQKFSMALETISNAPGWIKGKGLGPINNKIQTNTQKVFVNYINKQVTKAFNIIQKTLKKLLITNLNGQVVLTDEIIRRGSYLHSYNFLGTPQALFLLPNTYRCSSAYNLRDHNNNKLEHTEIHVNTLKNNRYELVIHGIPQHLRINLYNDSSQLVFSEQVNFKGNYSQVYSLNPFKAEGIQFEVIGKAGVFHSKKL